MVTETTTPRATAPPPSAAVFMAGREEVFVVKAQEGVPPAYPQALTHDGEAPPPYDSAFQYPNTYNN